MMKMRMKTRAWLGMVLSFPQFFLFSFSFSLSLSEKEREDGMDGNMMEEKEEEEIFLVCTFDGSFLPVVSPHLR